MRELINKILTYLLVAGIIATFVSVTAIVLIIAQGGKITPEGISKTGSIKLFVQPDNDLSVYVDNNPTSLKDKRIEGIASGTHTITIERPGYTTWTKEVEVEEGVVKDIYVNLFPEQLELVQITTQGIDRAFFSPDGSYVVYTITKSDDENNGIWKLKLVQNTLNNFGLLANKAEKLYPLDSTLASRLAQNYDIKIAPNNSRMLLITGDSQSIYSMDSDTVIELDRVETVGFKASRLNWFEDGDSLILEKDSTLYNYDISGNVVKMVYQFLQTPVYAVNGRSLIFYTNNTYYRYIDDRKSPLDIKADIKLPEAQKLWMSLEDDNLLYIKSQDLLYFVNLEKSLHEIGSYNLVTISTEGTNAIIRDNAQKTFNFRSEFIPATNKTNTSITQITQSSPSDEFKFGPDSLQIIQLVSNEDSTKTVYLYGVYAENQYELLHSRIIKNSDFSLVNESKDFVALLADSSQETDQMSESNNATTYNLYKIPLVE